MLARSLPPPQPREFALWRYLSGFHSEMPIAVRRDQTKGRCLALMRSCEAGEMLFREQAIIAVSDDPAVCLACHVRHAGSSSSSASCSHFTRLFGSLRSTLTALPALSQQTGYPEARLREIVKFIGLTYAGPAHGAHCSVHACRRTMEGGVAAAYSKLTPARCALRVSPRQPPLRPSAVP